MHEKEPEMPENHAPIVIVAGMSQLTRAIGKDNQLLWHVPADLKRFKSLTMGHPVIMGDKTFKSILDILGKPFPGRTNIVMTLDPDYSYEHESVKIAHSLEEAVSLAQSEDPKEIHIGGGGMIYKLFLPYTDRMYLTLFDDPTPGDTYFPEFGDEFTVTKEHEVIEHDGLTFQWIDYERKR